MGNVLSCSWDTLKGVFSIEIFSTAFQQSKPLWIISIYRDDYSKDSKKIGLVLRLLEKIYSWPEGFSLGTFLDYLK